MEDGEVETNTNKVEEPKTSGGSGGRVAMTPEELLRECLHGFTQENGRLSSYFTTDTFKNIGDEVQFYHSPEDVQNESMIQATADDDIDYDGDGLMDVEISEDQEYGERTKKLVLPNDWRTMNESNLKNFLSKQDPSFNIAADIVSVTSVHLDPDIVDRPAEKVVLPFDWRTMKQSNLMKLLHEQNPSFNFADDEVMTPVTHDHAHDVGDGPSKKLLLPAAWKTMKQNDLFRYLNNQQPGFSLPDIAEEDETTGVSQVIVLPRNWTSLGEDEFLKQVVKSNPKEVHQEVNEIFTNDKEGHHPSIGSSYRGPIKLPLNWKELSKEDLEKEISMKIDERPKVCKVQSEKRRFKTPVQHPYGTKPSKKLVSCGDEF